jgi:hypothetical protein
MSDANSTGSVSFQVTGIKESLKELNRLAPDLRRQITKDFKTITQPMVDAAKAATPVDPPLTGMNRKWKKIKGGVWNNSQVDRGIQVKIDTRRARKRNLTAGAQYETLGAFIFQSREVWGIIFDMAGRGGAEDRGFQNRTYGGQEYRYTWNNTLIRNLNAKWGQASRYMWPTAIDYQPQMEEAVRTLTERVADDITTALARQGTV